MNLVSYVAISGILLGQSWVAFAAQGDAKRISQTTKAQAKHFRQNHLKGFQLKSSFKRDLTIYRGKKDDCNVNIASNTSLSAKSVDIDLKAKNITVICKR